jgi:hypothetical protein
MVRILAIEVLFKRADVGCAVVLIKFAFPPMNRQGLMLSSNLHLPSRLSVNKANNSISKPVFLLEN